ncbi:acyltransferase family protein [Gaoshiqia sp. Z1-71]|uniref:acyltransferase family protein n=1 Tax=Gaoshiqia hydrogeniformans TaxID=3290090 RepID=UPI003BF7E8C8
MEPIRTEKKDRLLSLDALRGFDMFWIIGGEALFAFIGQKTGASWLSAQMEHVHWTGFHLYDLIFPLFMFIAGVAIPYAIVSKLEKNSPKKTLVNKVFKRMIILVILGIIYNGALRGDLTNIRFASVLGQIGLAYFFAAVIVIYTKSIKSRLYWLGGILTGYALIQLFVPVPGIGAGVLTPEGCINGYIDRLLLPGRLHGEVFDPEGLLCIISATGITLMGAVAGHILRGQKRDDLQKATLMAAIGAALVVLALIIHPFYPIIKKCWTTTFNLMAGGISFLLLSFFYLIIDVMKWSKWSFYFRIIGMNSIFVYLFVRFVDVERLSGFLFGWAPELWGDLGQFIHYVGLLALIWAILYYMYKKEVFLRV